MVLLARLLRDTSRDSVAALPLRWQLLVRRTLSCPGLVVRASSMMPAPLACVTAARAAAAAARPRVCWRGSCTLWPAAVKPTELELALCGLAGRLWPSGRCCFGSLNSCTACRLAGSAAQARLQAPQRPIMAPGLQKAGKQGACFTSCAESCPCWRVYLPIRRGRTGGMPEGCFSLER